MTRLRAGFRILWKMNEIPRESAVGGVELRLLGPVELLSAHGTAVRIGGSKERALLAVLATNAGRVVSDDRLVDSLWGNAPPRTAGRTLRSYVSRLRKLLAQVSPEGDLWLESMPGGWLLGLAPGVLDVARVESLAARGRQAASVGDHVGAVLAFAGALRAWRGQPLAEFADQHWASFEAGRWEELRQDIFEQRVDAELACGRHAQLIGELESACRANRLRERAWGQRMIALYRSGRQAEALRVYQELRRTLGEELGIEPSPALSRLERAILVHDPSLEGPSAATKASPLCPLPPALEEAAASLVGRNDELAVIEQAWAEARLGRRRTVFVSGEAGIGKSALLAHVARRASRQGAVVRYGRCDEHNLVPFQPYVEAFGHDLKASGDTEPHRIVAAVSELCRRIAAESPLLLIVEDLHWVDGPSLGLFRHLADRGGEMPLLLVGSYRDGDVRRGHPLADAVGDLERTGRATRLPLGGLSVAAAAALVAAATNGGTGPAPAQGLWAQTGGNPLLLRELLHGREGEAAAVEQLCLTDVVKDIIGRPLMRLSVQAHTALRAGSAMTGDIRLDVLEIVTSLTTDELLDAMDEAVAARVVHELPGDDGRWRFTHPLMGQVIYSELGAARRARLRQRLDQALSTLQPARHATRTSA